MCKELWPGRNVSEETECFTEPGGNSGDIAGHLVVILTVKKGLPILETARLQMWVILPSAYQHDIEFPLANKHSNIEELSCLSLQNQSNLEHISVVSIFILGQTEVPPVDSDKLRRGTQAHPCPSKIIVYTQRAWLDRVDPELEPFFPDGVNSLLRQDACCVG